MAFIPLSLIANGFANKLLGTEENGVALSVTAPLDSPNVSGLSGLWWYIPVRSRAYFKTGALNHSATQPLQGIGWKRVEADTTEGFTIQVLLGMGPALAEALSAVQSAIIQYEALAKGVWHPGVLQPAGRVT